MLSLLLHNFLVLFLTNPLCTFCSIMHSASVNIPTEGNADLTSVEFYLYFFSEYFFFFSWLHLGLICLCFSKVLSFFWVHFESKLRVVFLEWVWVVEGRWMEVKEVNDLDGLLRCEWERFFNSWWMICCLWATDKLGYGMGLNMIMNGGITANKYDLSDDNTKL